MKKRTLIYIEIFKIFVMSLLLGIIYDAALTQRCIDLNVSDAQIIGFSFLVMLGTVIVGSIILNIVVSIFTREKIIHGEWESHVNSKVIRNFSYTLSVFITVIMALLAFNQSLDVVIFAMRVGFFFLILSVNATQAFYYED